MVSSEQFSQKLPETGGEYGNMLAFAWYFLSATPQNIPALKYIYNFFFFT
jgi:hypothetical protein